MGSDAQKLRTIGIIQYFYPSPLKNGAAFSIAEGTVYALLVRVEQRDLVDVRKEPSEKGPPRKVFSINAQGRAYLEEFWATWAFVSERLDRLKKDINHVV